MHYERFGHALGHIGRYVFVVGGRNGNWVIVPSIERYDIIKDTWHDLNEQCNYEQNSCASTLVPVKQRFLFAFGGHDSNQCQSQEREQRFCRLDTYKLRKGWQILRLENPYTFSSYGCGVILLMQSRSRCEFLVVGGYTERLP